MKSKEEYYGEEMLFHNYIQDNYVFQKQYALSEKRNKSNNLIINTVTKQLKQSKRLKKF